MFRSFKIGITSGYMYVVHKTYMHIHKYPAVNKRFSHNNNKLKKRQ